MRENSIASIATLVLNKSVVKGSSSLTKFVLILDDGNGLEIEATGKLAILSYRLVPAGSLEDQCEAVCKVDWSWIENSRVTEIALQEQKVSLNLEPAGPLTITAQLWQGSAFLSFMPWRPGR